MAEAGEQLRTDVMVGAYRNSLLLFGNFILNSGLWSPFYMDIRPVPSISENPQRSEMSRKDQLMFRRNVVVLYNELLDSVNKHDHIQSIPEAVDHLVGMIGFHGDRSVLKRRVKAKDHGAGRDGILGNYNNGDVTVLVDDLITTSLAKVEEKERVEAMTVIRDKEGQVIEPGLVVNDAVVLLDRSTDGIETAQKAGLNVVAGFTLAQFIDVPHAEGIMRPEAHELILAYKEGSVKRPEDISPTWANLPVEGVGEHVAFA